MKPYVLLLWVLFFINVMNCSSYTGNVPILITLNEKTTIPHDIMMGIIKETMSGSLRCYSDHPTKIVKNKDVPIGYSWACNATRSYCSQKRELRKWKKLRELCSNLLLTNKSLCKYLSRESVRQAIIDYICVNHRIKNERCVAQGLVFNTIIKKIDFYHKKAKLARSFKKKECKKHWYLRSRTRYTTAESAIFGLNIDKITFLLPYMFNPQFDRYLYQTAAMLRKKKINAEKVYLVVKFFLEQKANPNWRRYDQGYTALVYAVFYNRKKIAALLLVYGANPNLQVSYEKKQVPIFDIENYANPTQGWLRTMYDKMKDDQFKKLLTGC